MKKIFLLAFTTVLFVSQNVFAIPAYPYPVNYELPDGSEITIQLVGDEWGNWAVTLDGFTMLRNFDGFWEYAVQNQAGDLELSGVRAHNQSERTTAERNFVAKLSKGLAFSPSQVEAMHELRSIRTGFLQRAEGDEPQRVSGNVRIPVILVEFADKKLIKTKGEFEMLFNQVGYSVGGAPGSLHDYFRDVSYDNLNLQVDVFGPYAMENNIGFYALREDCPSASPTGTQTMVRRAIDSAFYVGGADFSNYVIGGSTQVSTVHIIFAGFGTENGASACNSIWSHAWQISPVTHNGVTMRSYSCSPELRGNSGTNLTHIDVIAHELGHSLLGWPDFYDTDYYGSGGLAVDLGPWCLMASGSRSHTPGRPSAWCVVNAGWVPVITLSTPIDSVITLPNPMNAGVVYRINTKQAGGADNLNEYFLLENRQRVGWDANLPGSGMLIYHIDRPQSWGNCANCNPNRRRNNIKQAGCAATNGCSSSRQTDPWPQSQLGKTEFTDNSTPGSLGWTSNTTHTLTRLTERPITDIEHNTTARTVSFRFMANPRGDGAAVAIPTMENTTHNSITVHTIPPPGNGQTVEYAISTSNSATPISLSWQVATTFGGLWPLEFYYVYARSAANSEFYAGTPSISDVIQTNPPVNIRDVESAMLLQAWVQNGTLHIKGLTIGQIYRIYTISGMLVCQGVAKSDIEETQCVASLPSGTYIIQSENKSVKITL
ncbi:MAG: M6 family metalloprotease domain-containing protein [Bacteroidales bacterium]|jgi:M6 family metalloprotease-like protein|nr:M6 family metalloprotease domain-containing protein [Bacteroidales bacterium]